MDSVHRRVGSSSQRVLINQRQSLGQDVVGGGSERPEGVRDPGTGFSSGRACPLSGHVPPPTFLSRNYFPSSPVDKYPDQLTTQNTAHLWRLL